MFVESEERLARATQFRDLVEDKRDCFLHELWAKVGDGVKGQGGVSWGCLKPPLLHRRSDTP